jgi:hypothetical protein
MHSSRYDAATLMAPARTRHASSGWLSGLMLSITLRTALRLVAAFG